MRGGVVLAGGVAGVAAATFVHAQKLAPEGRGLLPRPPEATREAPSDTQQFSVDPSGRLSRTVFETDEDPNFKLIFRDFSFPPDKQPRTLILPSASFLHVLSGQGEIRIAKQRVELTSLRRTAAIPAGAPIEVANSGNYPMVLRALIVEAK
jgi:hypothetical protein